MRPALLAVLLSGCAYVAPESALRLAAIDPLSTDPANYAVSVAMDDNIGIEDGSVILSLIVTNPDQGEVGGAWPLKAARDVSGDLIYRVTEADRDAVRSVQRTAKDWEVRDPESTNGSLSLSVGPCLNGSLKDAEQSRLSAFLELSSGSSPIPLFRSLQVRQLVETSGLRTIPACQGTPDYTTLN